MSAEGRASGETGRMVRLISRNSVLIALLLLILFGALRYQNFLGVFNVLTVLRYNSMFALVSLGMCFVGHGIVDDALGVDFAGALNDAHVSLEE